MIAIGNPIVTSGTDKMSSPLPTLDALFRAGPSEFVLAVSTIPPAAANRTPQIVAVTPALNNTSGSVPAWLADTMSAKPSTAPTNLLLNIVAPH
jgi:hypothetical protein